MLVGHICFWSHIRSETSESKLNVDHLKRVKSEEGGVETLSGHSRTFRGGSGWKASVLQQLRFCLCSSNPQQPFPSNKKPFLKSTGVKRYGLCKLAQQSLVSQLINSLSGTSLLLWSAFLIFWIIIWGTLRPDGLMKIKSCRWAPQNVEIRCFL